MSWYVETLLRDSKKIRSNVETDLNHDVEDFDYCNLLRIEQVLTYLHSNRLINNVEITIINDLLNDKSRTQLSNEYELSRQTVSNWIEKITDKIASILGAEFTDDGYINYMTEKYNLDSDKVEKLTNYIHSNKRNN